MSPTPWCSRCCSVLEAALHGLIFGRLTRRESVVLCCGLFSCMGAAVELLIKTWAININWWWHRVCKLQRKKVNITQCIFLLYYVLPCLLTHSLYFHDSISLSRSFWWMIWWWRVMESTYSPCAAHTVVISQKLLRSDPPFFSSFLSLVYFQLTAPLITTVQILVQFRNVLKMVLLLIS